MIPVATEPNTSALQSLPSLSDPVFEKPQYSAIDRFFLKMIRDERDLPFIYLTLRISFLMIPVGLLMYVPGIHPALWWTAALLYFIMNNFVFKGPFGLMLHCTSHRKWFKKDYEIWNSYLPWFVGLFFGQTPETYASHHIGMHHRENNMPEDESSTMQYQRDKFGDFMTYFGDFIMMGLYRTVGYFKRKNRPTLVRKMIRGEFFFLFMCIGLSFISFSATLMVFMLPFVISRFIMMLGNWTQHSFIDPTDPGNHYKNSITCINTKYNWKCWNDGYHISHHIKPSMHWTDHPHHLTKYKEEYADNKALIFNGVDFLKIWIWLMNKNYDRLADNIVNVGAWNSKEEVIALMKERTRKFSAAEIEQYA